MFLVKDRRLGIDHFVFTHLDPRSEGFRGDLLGENVALDYDMNSIHLWPEGHPRPEPHLGQDPSNPKHYKVFKSRSNLNTAGFNLVDPNAPIVANSWSDYRKRFYPMPEEYAKAMTQDEWFDYLEGIDSAAKIRKQLNAPAEPVDKSNRDQIALWVARRHMDADRGIHEIWFLPGGAPGNEIRLLEVSEQYTAENSKIDPVDFGLDLGIAKYKLLVADISSNQADRIRQHEVSALPKNWKIDGAKIWGRRGPWQ